MKNKILLHIFLFGLLTTSCGHTPAEDHDSDFYKEIHLSICLYRKDSTDLFYTKDKNTHRESKSISSMTFTTDTSIGEVIGKFDALHQQTESCTLFGIGQLFIRLPSSKMQKVRQELNARKVWDVTMKIKAYNGGHQDRTQYEEILITKASFPTGREKVTYLGDFLATFREDK